MDKKKAKLIRASRLPVVGDHFDAFQADFRVLYDKILARFGCSMAAPKMLTEEEGKRAQWLVEKCQARLFKKYPLELSINLPKSALGWRRLMAEYGPLILAQARDSKDIIVIIQED